MTRWQDILAQYGKPTPWPYPIRYDKEQEIECDVLIIGGGIAGCWAAISAARTGAKVALVDKADVIRSGSGGPGCDHWCVTPANPHSKVDPDEWAKMLVEHPLHAGTPQKDKLPISIPTASASKSSAARTGTPYSKWSKSAVKSGTPKANMSGPRAVMTMGLCFLPA